MRLQARVTFTVYDDSECGPDDTGCEPVEFDEWTYLYGDTTGSLSAVQDMLMDLQSMLDDNPQINSWFTDIPLSAVAPLVGKPYVPDSAPTVFVDTRDGQTHGIPGTDFLAWTSAEDAGLGETYCAECGGYLVPGSDNHRHIRHAAA